VRYVFLPQRVRILLDLVRFVEDLPAQSVQAVKLMEDVYGCNVSRSFSGLCSCHAPTSPLLLGQPDDAYVPRWSGDTVPQSIGFGSGRLREGSSICEREVPKLSFDFQLGAEWSCETLELIQQSAYYFALDHSQ
jgi:hypothetical protein